MGQGVGVGFGGGVRTRGTFLVYVALYFAPEPDILMRQSSTVNHLIKQMRVPVSIH